MGPGWGMQDEDDTKLTTQAANESPHNSPFLHDACSMVQNSQREQQMNHHTTHQFGWHMQDGTKLERWAANESPHNSSVLADACKMVKKTQKVSSKRVTTQLTVSAWCTQQKGTKLTMTQCDQQTNSPFLGNAHSRWAQNSQCDQQTNHPATHHFWVMHIVEGHKTHNVTSKQTTRQLTISG